MPEGTVIIRDKISSTGEDAEKRDFWDLASVNANLCTHLSVSV